MQVFLIKLIFPANIQVEEQTLIETFSAFKKCIISHPFDDLDHAHAKNILDFVLEWLNIKSFVANS
jgi:hypothetical protein